MKYTRRAHTARQFQKKESENDKRGIEHAALVSPKMPTLYTQAKTTQTERVNKQGAHDIIDADLFAFVHQFAPNISAIYSKGNDTKNAANMFCFVGVGGIQNGRVFVRAEHVKNIFDMRLAVIHAATQSALLDATRAAYAAKHEGAQIDEKTARAVVKQNEIAAYKKMIERAIDAHLFQLPDETAQKIASNQAEMTAQNVQESLANVARGYANGDYRASAPFALLAIAEELPAVETRGITVSTARGEFGRVTAALKLIDVDVDVDALIDAAFA